MKGQWLTSSQGLGSSLSNVCGMGKKLIFTIWWYFWPQEQLEKWLKGYWLKDGWASQSQSFLSRVSILWQMSHPRVLSSLPTKLRRGVGGPAGFQCLELFYMKPRCKLPMGSCSFRRGHIILNQPRNPRNFRDKICRSWWISDIVLLTLKDNRRSCMQVGKKQ